ncbi:TDP-N-acetylfucosamine:lipid II N-acetylfucosaminyltransferase [Vibrio sp. TRT 17S01]|uniref:TDP-N-acetylfucosamine:lipid II N-acetylfucosaminyltransferase n=1 Tax=Vibrio sp. TRT 17S01 TaxID=3418505 RepID=UPI003CEEE101
MTERLKVLHIIVDDKFTNSLVKFFSFHKEFDCHYAIFAESDFNCTYLSKDIIKKINLAFLNNRNIDKNYFEQYSYIFIHSLKKVHVNFINRNPNLNFVWIGMGFDYYDLVSIDLYEGYSKNFLDTYTERLKVMLGYKCYSIYRKKRAIEKISYFSPVLSNEFELISNEFEHLKRLTFNYGGTAGFIDEVHRINENAADLLLGNSADPSNNHYEALKKLNDIKFKGKIYIPLSYGNEKYKKSLINELVNFDLNIIVLEDFLSREEYFTILKSCRYVIMNHKRQQGAGNVVTMLSMGAEVYLNCNSLLYSFLLDQGVVVFETLDINEQVFPRSMSNSERVNNRKVIKKLFGSKTINANIRNIGIALRKKYKVSNW